MNQNDDILVKLSNMLTNMEVTQTTIEEYTVNDYYMILIRSFMEIRKLRHQVKVLEAKLNVE